MAMETVKPKPLEFGSNQHHVLNLIRCTLCYKHLRQNQEQLSDARCCSTQYHIKPSQVEANVPWAVASPGAWNRILNSGNSTFK